MAIHNTHDRKRSKFTPSHSASKKRKVSVSDDSDRKQRSNQACDRCRLKKVKCDGAVPCERCSQSDSICQSGVQTSRAGKSVSAGHVNQLQAHNEILATALRELWQRHHHNDREISHTERRSAPPIHVICQEMGSIDGQQPNASENNALDAYYEEEHLCGSHKNVSNASPAPTSVDSALTGPGSSSETSMINSSPPPSLDMAPPLTANSSPETSSISQASGYLPTPQSLLDGKAPDEHTNNPFEQPFDHEQSFYMPQQNFSTASIDYAPDMKPMYGPGQGHTPLQYDPRYGFGMDPFQMHQAKGLEFDDMMDMGDSSYEMPDWGFTLSC